MAVLFSNGIIQINELRNDAVFSQGKTVADGWSFIGKTNIAVGQVPGNFNVFPAGVNFLLDSDLSDMLVPNAGVLSPTVGSIPEAL